MARRIGHAMAAVAAYVASNEGCVMRAAADHVNPSVGRGGNVNEALGYNVVHRAANADLIVIVPAEQMGGRRGTYVLYTPAGYAHAIAHRGPEVCRAHADCAACAQVGAACANAREVA